MQTNIFSVAQLFEGRLLRVPDYQRGYSWEEPQLRDFIEDIELLGDKQVHYAGTVVLHRTERDPQMDEDGRTHVALDVVDGQQRLTTIVILLCVLRRELARIGAEPNLQEGIRRSFLWVNAHGTRARLTKLSLAGELGDYFERRVLAELPTADAPKTQSEARIDDARVRFTKFLAARGEALGDGYAAWLVGLYAKVTQRLKTSLFSVESEADVGVIFEVLNNRGKPLSELEKVKNYLLYVAAKTDEDGKLARKINKVWSRVLHSLMAGQLTRSQDEDQLLRTHWLLAYDPNERAWDGSRSIKAKIDLRAGNAPDVLYAAADSYLDTLEEVALSFADIENPQRHDAFRGVAPDDARRREIALWVERLHRLGFVAPFRPLLAAARRAGPLDDGGHVELLKACERFSFLVYRVAGCRPNAGRSWLYRLGHRLFLRETDIKSAAASVASAIGWYCRQQAYDRFFEVDPESPRSFYEWGGIRYLLYEWETHLAGPRQVMLSWRELHQRQPKTTIEHVLPQTPVDPYWSERFDDEARRVYTHDLGNLCLTEDNSVYGNKPFAAKRGEAGAVGRCYSTSNLFSERALARATEWTPQAIVARHDELAAWAKERWPWSGGESEDAGAIAEEAETGDA